MSELTKFMDDLERIHTKIYESMRKFDAWCDTRQAAGLKTGDDDLSWQAWQAAIASVQEELAEPIIYVDAGHLREVSNGNDMLIYASSEQDEQGRLEPLFLKERK